MANFYAKYPVTGGGGGGAVDSVNGQTGTVLLDASDIPYNNTVSGLSATDVQDALDEISDGTKQNSSSAIYVDAVGGNDTTGTGSFLCPVATLNKAVTLVTNPMLNYAIRLAPGTYNGATVNWPPNADLFGSGTNSTNINNTINYTAASSSVTNFNVSLATCNDIQLDFTNADIALPTFFDGQFKITRTDTKGSGPWAIRVNDSNLGDSTFGGNNLLSNCLFISNSTISAGGTLFCTDTIIGVELTLHGDAKIGLSGCVTPGVLTGITESGNTPNVITDASSISGTTLSNVIVILNDKAKYVDYDNGSSGLTAVNVQDAIDELSSGSSGANQTLSNLTSPTAINQDLTFDKGSNALISTNDGTGATRSWNLNLKTGDQPDSARTGAINLFTGDSASSTSGVLSLSTGSSSTGSGGINLTTGPSDNGNTGDIVLTIGTPTITGDAGNITLQGADSPSGQGTNITVNAGSGPTAGNITLQGGSASSGSNASGAPLNIFGGNGDGTGVGADININSGYAGDNTPANINLNAQVTVLGGAAPGQKTTLKIFGADDGFATNIQSATTASDVLLVLPATQGTANTVLLNDGSGNTSWSSVTAANVTYSNTSTGLFATNVQSAIDQLVPGPNQIVLFEDFCVFPAQTVIIAGSTNQVGLINVASTNSSGPTYTPFVDCDLAGNFGTIAMNVKTNANGIGIMGFGQTATTGNLSSMVGYATGDLVAFQTRMNNTSINVDNNQVVFGLIQGVYSYVADINSQTTAGVYMVLLEGTDQLYAVVCDGSTSVVGTNPVTINANDYNTYKIVYDGTTNIAFSVNGTVFDTLDGSIMLGTQYSPTIQSVTTSSSASSTRAIIVDYMSYKHKLTSAR